MHSRGFVRFLYTHNPFYLLSAALILYGLQAAFDSGQVLADPRRAWQLAGALFAYTSLMAVTGCLIVRLGGVWEDARSIVLILLLLFVAISTSFDQICNTFPSTAAGVLFAGFAFTVLITEGVLRGLKIFFPWLYRLPYYALMSSFFLYPLWTSTLITGVSDDVVAWRVFLYPAICGLISLTLIPAIRKTSRYVKGNGTPWLWPWFPWTVFVFLAVGVCGRAMALSFSFVPGDGWKTPFGMYFLIPVAAGILVLLLEIAHAERLPRLAHGVLCAAPILVLMSHAPLGSDWYERFLGSVTNHLGSPLWLSTLLLGALYVYAWSKGLRRAEVGVVGSLLGAAVIDPQTRSLMEAGNLQYWPLLLVGAWQVAVGLTRQHSLRTLGGALCFLGGAALRFEDTWFTGFHGFLPYHLALATVLWVGCRFDDMVARMARNLSALWLVGSGSYVVLVQPDHMPMWLATFYGICLSDIALAIWQCFRKTVWLVACLGNLGSLLVAQVSFAWSVAHRELGWRAALALSIGLLCFVVAAAISSFKGGIRPALNLRLKYLFK